MPRRGLRAAMALAGVSMAACASPFQRQEDTLAIAEARWRAAGLMDYRFGFTRSCECLPSATRSVTIAVSGGAFVSATYLDDGTPADTALFRDELTLDRLFASLHEALARHPATFAAQYEPTLGYPMQVSIDYSLLAADDETFFTVFDVGPLRSALRP
jgi:uncharacterized protein DUF6174